METKERILEAALELFSKKGFDSSSVRDIASIIGIKDSSLYFHFKSKQAILDALIEKFIGISMQMMEQMNHILKAVTAIDDDGFYAVTRQYAQSYFLDRFMGRMMMVMNHERSHNQQLMTLYVEWCMEKPLAFQTMVMEKLQEAGFLHVSPPQYMALAYYAPVFLYFNQYMSPDYTEQEREAFLAAVMNAAKNFINTYRKGR